MATKQTTTNSTVTRREYIQKNPIRSTISAVGYGTVNTIELVVDMVDTARAVNRLLHKQLLAMEAELDVELGLNKTLAQA